MKKLFKAASLLFYFFVFIEFFIIGATIAKLVGAGKNQMLAGGAIVLFYGLITAVIALIVALFVASKVTHRRLVNINKILGILFLFLAALLIYRISILERKTDPVEKYPKKTTSPAIQKISLLEDGDILKRHFIDRNRSQPKKSSSFELDFFSFPKITH